jgi:DHA1 family bicyclomycin/chloramphenicol resistance-like MFS transporter
VLAFVRRDAAGAGRCRVGTARQHARRVREPQLSGLGLAGRGHLRWAVLLSAAVANGLHRLSRRLSLAAYGWIPAGGSLVYIFSTTLCRRLLRRIGPVGAVQLGAVLSMAGAAIQALGCWVAPHSAMPLLAGHAVYCPGHGIHQPCGQAGAVGDLPHLAGRAVSWSGFGMMMVAFGAGQIAAQFVDTNFSRGAWPMLLAGGMLLAIAFAWLPRLSPQPSIRKETP